MKHVEGKRKLKKKEAREKDIAAFSVDSHLVDETLPEHQQVYREKVVTRFLHAEIPLACFRELLEENGVCLSD